MLEHPLFRALGQFIKVEPYARDGGHKHPRFRLEWHSTTPADINRAACEIEVACARCGATMRPFRLRKPSSGRGHMYVAVACPHPVNRGCANSRPAADAVDAVAAALGHER